MFMWNWFSLGEGLFPSCSSLQWWRSRANSTGERRTRTRDGHVEANPGWSCKPIPQWWVAWLAPHLPYCHEFLRSPLKHLLMVVVHVHVRLPDGGRVSRRGDFLSLKKWRQGFFSLFEGLFVMQSKFLCDQDVYSFAGSHNAVNPRNFRLLISDVPQPRTLERSGTLRSSSLCGFILIIAENWRCVCVWPLSNFQCIAVKFSIGFLLECSRRSWYTTGWCQKKDNIQEDSTAEDYIDLTGSHFLGSWYVLLYCVPCFGFLRGKEHWIVPLALRICDPLWEKVPLGGKYIIEIWAEIAKNAMVLANLVFVTGENYGLTSTVWRWSCVNTLHLALVASLQSCGRRLDIHCVIEIPCAISRNSARGMSRTFTHIVRERKGLRTYGFRHRM